MPSEEPQGIEMKMLLRAIGVLLLGWFVFMIGAAVFAASRRRELPDPDPKADEVELNATFGPLEFRSEAGAFRGGSVTTWFGGGEIDLSNATLAPEGATLHMNALFGGGNLIVPESWNIETRLVGIGGAGDGRPAVERPDDAPTLRVEGTALFGGWGITSGGNGHEELVTA
jgi:predicted membrane protein